MAEVVLVAAARTPFGKLGGSLSSLAAPDLGAVVIREVLDRTKVAGEDVDQVIMGTVITAGMGQIPARQAALRAGLPTSVSALTVNKVCASSLKAINLAALLIRTGEARVVVAGGMESMSQAPYLLPQARFGYRLGDGQLRDSMLLDGLIDPANGCHMAVEGSMVAKEFEVSRERQDAYAYQSQQRYARALEAGRFREEVVPVAVPTRKGTATVSADEQPRPDTTLEGLARLAPVYTDDGTITAGNAPGVNDGAAAVLLMSEAEATRRGLPVLAEWLAFGESAADTPYLATVPASAIQAALKKVSLKVADMDLFEINEAFSAVACTAMDQLGVDEKKVNVDGGAVAVGHPIGASGARILMHLVYELRRRGGRYGAAGICSGMAQGEATIVRARNGR
ncbi:MAG TPA: acetyl-CoA C-acetyltransferase [Candidatus Limnocylindrales bacterium]|nr:acetyl-CoA C-acetyltransferase [Candidatus Limnocylindrales bacterium]